MESILVWTLIIAAIAIVSMLALLIASEREVKRIKVEAESLRASLGSVRAEVNEAPEMIANEDKAISAGVTSLTEQVRANEVAIANLQCELEALRAENSWLKQQGTAYQTRSPEPEIHAVKGISSPQIEETTVRATDYRLGLVPPRSGLLFPVVAIALLLVALASIYFARGRMPLAPTRQAEFGAEARSQGNLSMAGAVTPATDTGDVKTDREMPSKTLPAKKSAGTPPGTSYEVVRSTRLFSEPNESSRPLARIEAGMEINVVGARDEWLEVRSRHGRPPGYIRRDTAILKSSK